MTRNISFQIENTTFQGKLIYGNGNENEIKCTLFKPYSKILQDMFQSENGCIFTLNGRIENIENFTATNCDVRDGIIPIYYHLVEKDRELNYKINIGTLYIGVSNIDKTVKNIKKCEFKISHEIPFLKNTEQIYISKHNFNIKFDENIIIKFENSVSLDELNQILFDLKIFFQILVLNKDIEIIEKYFYLEDETKIEEIKKYEKDEGPNQSITTYLIKENDKFNIENSLNIWFEAKEKYGKIFDYLSGILKESTLKHMEFKLFALSQWIEAYSREFLKDSALQIINNSLIKDIDKKFLNSITGKNNTFRTNLNGLFIIKNLEQLVFDNLNSNKKDCLISDIICYRNNLTHLNVKDNLNNQQAVNLYEILKNLIYLFIMEELQVQDNRNYDKFKNEVNHFYKKYNALYKTIRKCANK
ncbi:hypothetical protein O8C83_05895 [Aliarcobacter butzleri]|uniref:HEPN domain-containing protein n=1 Tax=Aliarcobacter butzleri TaxID=28197 RepID=UPI00263DC359|nr:hypothetical protein [Aliarcobacter butzleri]MDN5100349.1 hypothetical protein [Aliarcobacter butzleri]